jgi:hypothetical protein
VYTEGQAFLSFCVKMADGGAVASLMVKCAMVAMCVAGLDACHARLPAHVESEGQGTRFAQEVRIVVLPPSADQEVAGELSSFASLLASELRSRGVGVSEAAGFELTLTLSRRPANIGMTQSRDGYDGFSWLSRARKWNPLRVCSPMRTRVVMLGYLVGDDRVDYSARGEFDSCSENAWRGDVELSGKLADSFVKVYSTSGHGRQ